MKPLLLSFYGDDFTGSTDAMESLARAGVTTVLFTDPPTPEQLSRYPHIRAFGIAGMTRAMPPEQMAETLRPALQLLKASGAPIVHYKVCSTFDSSPQVGSIGQVIDIGSEIFGSPVPVVVGAPPLGRYCVFGNLFARCGPGSEPFRLDRHPSMSLHPVTPMSESDLRLHLSKQTNKKIGLINITELSENPSKALQRRRNEGAEVILIDLLDDSQFDIVGSLLITHSFVVGSSGVEMALTAYWKRRGVIAGSHEFRTPVDAGPIVVVSGSCSPVTAGQIRSAIEAGFVEIILDPRALDDSAMNSAAASALSSLGQRTSVIIHTGPKGEIGGSVIGCALGTTLRRVLEQAPVHRVMVAGGDTSGQVARTLGIESVEMIGELTRGSPLCRATAPGSPADGIEITFKGGQIGGEDFFQMVKMGGHE